MYGGIAAGILAAPFTSLAAVPVAAAKGANSEDF
jgi:hypothetical protein